MKTKLLLTAGLVVLVTLAVGSVQAAPGTRVNIPFSFMVNGVVLPAGEYELLPGNSEEYVQVLSLTKGPSAGTLIVTRVSGPSWELTNNTQVVFDKIGDTYTLSELWLPQMSGFQLYASKEAHERKVVLNGRP
jgi:hypothetical protein